MASRLNTKLILILVGCIVPAVVLLVALMYLQERGDAAKNIAVGDEYFQSGDYELAMDYYGRALSKDKGNREYLHKLENALLQIRPETSEEARDLYQRLIQILKHDVLHHPTLPEAHRRLIDELFQSARVLDEREAWLELADAADAMWEQLYERPEDDPQRLEARLYRGLAKIRLDETLLEEEIIEAQHDLEAYLAVVPNHDLGWASLLLGRAAIAFRMQSDGTARRIREAMDAMEQTHQQALENVPDGPEIARANFAITAMKRFQDPEAVSADRVREAANRMIELVGRSEEPWLITGAAELLRNQYPGDGLPRARTLVKDYLDRHPDAIVHRYLLAFYSYRADDLEEAQTLAQSILDAPPLPVGFISQAQYGFRKRATGLLVDVAFRRWELAADAEKPAQLRRVVAARDALEGIVADPEDDPLLLWADGKIAFARRDYQKATARFERLVRETPAPSVEIIAFAAQSLEELGQIGLAHERLMSAVRRYPTHLPFLYKKAELEYRLRQFENAKTSIDTLRKLYPEYEPAGELQTRIEARLARQEIDPVDQAITEAGDALEIGDSETARAVLLAALEEHETDLRLLEVLTRIELTDGQDEAAAEYVRRALEVQPTSDRFRQYQARLEHADPIEARREYLRSTHEDPAEFTVAMIMNMSTLARDLDAAAARRDARGDRTGAQQAREIAERARQEVAGLLEDAERLAPDHPLLLEYFFQEAVLGEDWDEVDRLVLRARELNADQADGLLYQGRAQLLRQQYPEAVRSLEQATEIKGYSASGWRNLAYAYQQVGNVSGALDAFEQAYRCNPNDTQMLEAYVALLIKTGEQQRALIVQRHAHELRPRDAGTREVWLQLESEVGNPVQAFLERRSLYERNPREVMNAVRLAEFLGTAEPTRELLVDETGRELYPEVRWARLGRREKAQIVDQARARWRQEADKIVTRLEQAAAPDAATQDEETAALHRAIELALADDARLKLAVLRATLLRSSGRSAAGEQVLRAFIDQQAPEDITVQMLLALSDYLSKIDRVGGSIQVLEEARAYQDGQRMEADRALGALYFSIQGFELAATHFQRVLQAGSDRNVELRLVECLVKLDRPDEAEQRLARVIARDGEDYLSTMLSAAIAASRGQAAYLRGEQTVADEQFQRQGELLARAEALDARTPEPSIIRARSLLGAFRRTGDEVFLSDALEALARADEIRADEEEAILLRAEVDLARGNRRGAISELTRLLQRSPDSTLVRRRLVLLQLENPPDVKAAERTLIDATERYPSLVYWWELLGDLYLMHQGDVPKAIATYQRALQIQPTRTVLGRLADAMLAGSPEQQRGVITLLEGHQEMVREFPQLRSLYARALNSAGRREEALQQQRLAYERSQEIIRQTNQPETIESWFRATGQLFRSDPSAAEQFVMEVCQQDPSTEELRWMARLWASSGGTGLARAAEILQQAIDAVRSNDVPLLVGLYLELGTYHLQLGQAAPAAAAFQRVIDLSPHHVLALNNLAYLTAEQLGDPEKALPLAAEAARLNPLDPDVLDTLGWIQFALGRLEEAEQNLRKAVERQETAVNRLHLAAVLARRGRLDLARTNLERALELRPDAQTQTQIDRLADDIRTRRGQGG